MELEWPQLAPDKLICFQRFFRSPLQLDAAFDNDLESLELIQSIFPDMVAEDVMDIVALLMVWKESSDRTFKRARRQVARSGHVLAALCRFRVSARCLQTAFTDKRFDVD